MWDVGERKQAKMIPRTWATEWMVVAFTEMGESEGTIPWVGGVVENEKVFTFCSMNTKEPKGHNTSFWKPLTTPSSEYAVLSFLAKTSSMPRFLAQRRKERGCCDSQKDHNEDGSILDFVPESTVFLISKDGPPACMPFFLWRSTGNSPSSRLGWPFDQRWAIE